MAPQCTRLERVIIAFGEGMVVLSGACVVWGFLTASFFACCGIDAISWANPRLSALGPVATVVLVWPAIGLLCLAGDGLGDVLVWVTRGLKRGLLSLVSMLQRR